MSIETMTKLATYTVGATPETTFYFTNIPQTYTDLVLLLSLRTNRAGAQEDGLSISLNSTNGTAGRTLIGDGSAASSVNSYASYAADWSGRIPGATATSNTFSNTYVYIPNYTSSFPKTVMSESVTEHNATTAYLDMTARLSGNVIGPVTSLGFGTNASFVQHSTFTLYGIRNARKTAGNSIKATGGNISFDGTYVYHAFTSTGSFVPTQSLTADALVIAGGGSGASGGNSAGAGGGGAGGLLGFTNQYFSVGSSYVCTVGAGGAAVSQYGGTAANGNTGNDSQLASLTLVKGGGFGGGGLLDGVGGNGGNGGSGGGAGRWSNSTTQFGGSPTSGQGFKGGDAISTGAGGRCAGGGGGAGQAGTNTTNVGTATGGNGVNTYESWARATNTGENGYYAGGGGGSAIGQGPAAGGLGGGGIGPLPLTTPSGATQTAGSGRPNTGSGGGGMGGGDIAQYKVSGSGGSGLIIIRYKA